MAVADFGLLRDFDLQTRHLLRRIDGVGAISPELSPNRNQITMLHLELPHYPVNIPLFLWETIFNCSCLRLYSDGSQWSAAVIEEVACRIPIVLYNETRYKSPLFLSCNIVAVFKNVSVFEPPQYFSFLNILLTAENSDDTNIARLHRYNRKIFFWIAGIASNPVIQSFDENEEIQVIHKNAFRALINSMLAKSLKLPNFMGKNILITVANHSVYSLIGKSDSNETELISGFEYDTIDFVCSLLNLTKIILPAKEVGNLENGNATGIISDVVNDRTDVAIGGIWLNAEMATTVEFIHPSDRRCGHYLVPRPSQAVKESNIILLPFEESLWVTIGAAIFIGSGIKTLFARFLDEGFGRKYQSFKWSLYASIMHLILRCYPTETENRGVMRPLFVSWSWLSFMLVTVYSSQLAAILVNPRYEDKPQTVPDFYKKGYYWGGPSNQPSHLYQITFSPVYGTLWHKERFLLEDSVDDRNARMEKGTYVVKGESTGDYFFLNDHHMPREDIVKKYEAAGRCYAVFNTAPIFPRGSPYSELFNRVVSLMRESGIKKKRKKTLFSREPIKNFLPRNVFSFTESNKTKEFIPVNLSLVGSPFILLMAGHSIAVIIFLGEHFCHKRMHSNWKQIVTRRRNVKLTKVRRLPYNE